GIDFTEIQVHTELGPAPAWYVPGKGDTWVVMVHGGNGRRQGNLHALQAFHDAGLPILDITYRNDLGAPRSPDHLIHAGATEWRDVEAAAKTAQSMGAKKLVIFGASMGGSIVGQFMVHSAEMSKVKAVVLENPMVSPPQTIDAALGGWKFVGPLARAVTGWRIGVDLDDLDLMRHPPRIKPPTLVFHGDADRDIDVNITRRFVAAAKRMDWPVQYEEFPGAGHTEEWNLDHTRYHDTVVAFLKRTLPVGG
ncbi:MAG: prolyl oligopeptidase family serine peptidase, partial [Nonomuraea sp.]|nr:prolyl oligopeptidase family serine peptidase [Nonomuraea sp.]